MHSNVLPKHVAIIMDGNGRWAKAHKLAVVFGHRKGVERLRDIIRYSSQIGIACLSLYAFSTENWKRSKEEVAALMALMVEFFNSEIDELDSENVKIIILGDKKGLPEKQRNLLVKAEERTRANTGLTLNLAINYGSKAEIVMACKELVRKVQSGDIDAAQIDEELFSDMLYTRNQPAVDLLIRTSGEMRVSNFLLYQIAYAEMSFPNVLWPDYTLEMYRNDLNTFTLRERRYGGRET